LGLVAGFTAVIALFGAGAAALGGLFADPVAARVAGGILTAVAGATLLVARFRPDLGPLSRTRQLVARVPGQGSWWRPLALGVAFGLIWTPCVGPLLGAALGPAVGSGSPLSGAALLAAYAAGLGLPFVAMSLGLEAVPGALPRVRRFGPPAGLVAGVALVVLGLLLATGVTDSVVPGAVARAVS
jgi:cytochrome c-type biogenesis protein